MIFQLTAAGVTQFNNNPNTFQVTRVVLGDGFGYELADPPTNIQGDPVFDRTQTWDKEVMNANTMRFTTAFDNTIGDFDFGEAALYNGATIVAVGVSSQLIAKVEAEGAEQGNIITLAFFATSSNSGSYGFVKQTNSDSRLTVSNVVLADYLEPPYVGDPNAYIVNGQTPEDVPALAFSDLYGRWNFTDKPRRYYEGEASGTPTTTALDIATPHGVTFLSPNSHIIQWTSGRLRGYVRKLVAINSTSFQWSTPTQFPPEAGDLFIIVGPEAAIAGGQNPIQFKDEGSNLGGATVTSVNFIGAGVTATRTLNQIDVTIPGGGDPGDFQVPIQFQEQGSDVGPVGEIDEVNFTGTGVSTSLSGNQLSVQVNRLEFQDAGDDLGTVNTVNLFGSGIALSLTEGGLLNLEFTGGTSGDAVWEVYDFPTDPFKAIGRQIRPVELPVDDINEAFVYLPYTTTIDTNPPLSGETAVRVNVDVARDVNSDIELGPASLHHHIFTHTNGNNDQFFALYRHIEDHQFVRASRKFVSEGRSSSGAGVVSNSSSDVFVALLDWDNDTPDQLNIVYAHINTADAESPTLFWQVRHSVPGFYVSIEAPLVLDAENSVLYSFITLNSLSDSTTIHVLTKMSTSDGSVVWQRQFTGTDDSSIAKALAVRSITSDASLIFVTIDDTIVALDSAGAILWQKAVTDSDFNPGGTFRLEYVHLLQNETGFVYVVFKDNSINVAVLKLDETDGSTEWCVGYSNVSGERAALLADPNSESLFLLATGLSAGLFYARLDLDGNELFTRDLFSGDIFSSGNTSLEIGTSGVAFTALVNGSYVGARLHVMFTTNAPEVGITPLSSRLPGLTFEVATSSNSLLTFSITTGNTTLGISDYEDMEVDTPTYLMSVDDLTYWTTSQLKGETVDEPLVPSLNVVNMARIGSLSLGNLLPPPTSSVGSLGDVEGMIRADSNFIYYCKQDYDGTTDIWVRQSWEDSGTWP